MSQVVRILLSGAAAGSYVVSRSQPLTVGRAGRARVYDLAASRLHCRVEWGDKGLRLVDLHSTNGTYLNGERVAGCEILRDGDEIRIGTSTLKVALEQDREEPRSLRCAQCGAQLSPASFAGAGAFERAGQLYCGLCGTRPSMPVPSLDDEALVSALMGAGFREIERLYLEGAEALYNGRRAPLGQPVTLKVLDTEMAEKARIDAFLREARTAARLSHPNVARIIDVGSFGNVVYTVLERVEGRTLAGEIAERQRLAGRRALAVGLPLSRALAYLHEQRVLHRDIRPGNVLCGAEGDVKLLGFGRARPFRELAEPNDEPIPEASRPYAAPELFTPVDVDGEPGLPPRVNWTERADIYAFGATVFHAIAGRPPAAGEGARDLLALAPEVPPPLAALIGRCIARAPHERFASARDLHAAVENAVRALYGFEGGSSEAVGVLVHFGPAEILSDTTRRTVSEGLPAGGGGGEGEGTALFGRFSGSELIELAQLIDLNAKSGVLEVRAPNGDRGVIALRQGRAIQARFRDLTGRDAVFAVLQLESGQFRMLVGEPSAAEEHQLPLSPCLLEIMRRQDERGAAVAAASKA